MKVLSDQTHEVRFSRRKPLDREELVMLGWVVWYAGPCGLGASSQTQQQHRGDTEVPLTAAGIGRGQTLGLRIDEV